MAELSVTRRRFLQWSAATAGAGVLVGCSSKQQRVFTLAEEQQEGHLSAWLLLRADNTVEIIIPSAEMGQGVYTSMAQLVADELEMPWENVSVKPAPWSDEFANPMMRMQITGGSTSISKFWLPMRQIGANMKLMLKQAAANEWGVAVSSVQAKDGKLSAGGQQLSYGDLVKAATELEVPEEAPMKDPAEFKLIGKSVKRNDLHAKHRGRAEFGVDVKLPGLKVATVSAAPIFGQKLETYDANAALAVKGVDSIHDIDGVLAVVAEGYWQAKKALTAAKPKFTGEHSVAKSNAEVDAIIDAGLDKNSKKQLNGENVLGFEYRTPFLAHATMEPMSCTVWVQNDRADVWVPSQSQTMTGRAVAELTGLPEEQVFVHLTYLGGGFGRRGEADFVIQATRISQESGKPIKLIWSREEDTQHDFYRPATAARIQVELDEQGYPLKWRTQMAGDSIFKRLSSSWLPGFLSWIPLTSIIGDPVAVEGASKSPYCEDLKLEFEIVDTGIPVGFWRSVGHSNNSFYMETVIDELAANANVDPAQYRLKLLQAHDARAANALKEAMNIGNYGNPAAGNVQAVAVHESFGSYVGCVIEGRVEGKQVRIAKVTLSVDCGMVVNPDTIKAQLVGGFIYGLTAAVSGDMTIEESQVKQSNFHDYRMVMMQQTPEFDVSIIKSVEAPGGIGEPGTPMAAPALGNLIYAATGERLREMPIAKSGYSLGTHL
jgi:isoquinoline 1-oxidoreductase beta subunit